MRVVHISDCYPPRAGGIEAQVADLTRAQAQAGLDVHVLTATPGEDSQNGGVTVHRMPNRVLPRLPVNPGAAGRVRRLLAELAPDVVHVHAGFISPFAYDGARIAVAEGLPLAITWHCMLTWQRPMRAAAQMTKWRGAPVALSAVSRAAAERVECVLGAPVEVLPNGIDIDRWLPGPRASAEPLRCVAAMRLAPRKRGPALIRLIADAAGQLEPGALRLAVFGDGPARQAMQRRIRRRRLSEVVSLRGRVGRHELVHEYAAADVFLAPAELEAFGLAALEARTAGLVVIARRGTGAEEYLTDGFDGLLVDDDAAMARAVVRLAEDREMLEALVRRAREQTPVHSWQHTVTAAAAQYSRARALRGFETVQFDGFSRTSL
jgi:glycosyltransferase involved in cell wall biosynthesis